jgi:hypothetical protein
LTEADEFYPDSEVDAKAKIANGVADIAAYSGAQRSRLTGQVRQPGFETVKARHVVESVSDIADLQFEIVRLGKKPGAVQTCQCAIVGPDASPDSVETSTLMRNRLVVVSASGAPWS